MIKSVHEGNVAVVTSSDLGWENHLAPNRELLAHWYAHVL
jgi:hypothetical protein